MSMYFVRRVNDTNQLLLQDDPESPEMDVVEWDEDTARATVIALNSVMQWVTFFPGEEIPEELLTPADPGS